MPARLQQDTHNNTSIAPMLQRYQFAGSSPRHSPTVTGLRPNSSARFSMYSASTWTVCSLMSWQSTRRPPAAIPPSNWSMEAWTRSGELWAQSAAQSAPESLY